MTTRDEPCPDCGHEMPLTELELRRGRARCSKCALDVRLERDEVGEGPGRTSSYLAVTSPALLPSRRFAVERDAHHLAISLAPYSRVTAASVGLAIAMLLVAAGFLHWVPLAVSAVAFLAILAVGFTMASRERSDLTLVVEHGALRINGRSVEAEAIATLDQPDDLSDAERHWLREIVDARIAGDLDQRAG